MKTTPERAMDLEELCDRCCGFRPDVIISKGRISISCGNCGDGVDTKEDSERDELHAMIEWNKRKRE